MYKYLLFALLLSACSQDPSVINNPPAESLTGRYWICDSVKSTAGGTQIVGQGLGYDLEFFTTGIYTIHALPDVSKNYLRKQDTMYYWTSPGTMQPTKYFLIKSLTNKKLHIWQALPGDAADNYYHYN